MKEPINLNFCRCVESNLNHKHFKYVFSIVTKQRTYYLVAESKEDMETWVEKICNVCGFQRADVPNMAGKDTNASGNVLLWAKKDCKSKTRDCTLIQWKVKPLERH